MVAPIADVQSSADTRRLPIHQVGIKGVRYPVTVATAAGEQPSVAEFTMTVALPAEQKGTHMSRFVALLEEHKAPLSSARLPAMLDVMLGKLEAVAGRIEIRLPYFVEKAAPVSGVKSLLDYEVTFAVERAQDAARAQTSLKVVVPVTSLCPCSKEISDYGAHNQRSHVTIGVTLATEMTPEQLIRIAEDAASSELYGLLKRVDEKYVTEAAYDNPKFVEDLVRDVVSVLQHDQRVARFDVEVENFESIHNHSAYARITGAGGAAA